MTIVVTPFKAVFRNYCWENSISPLKVVLISNEKDFYKLYGCEFTMNDVVFLDDWFEIPNVQDFLVSKAKLTPSNKV